MGAQRWHIQFDWDGDKIHRVTYQGTVIRIRVTSLWDGQSTLLPLARRRELNASTPSNAVSWGLGMAFPALFPVLPLIFGVVLVSQQWWLDALSSPT